MSQWLVRGVLVVSVVLVGLTLFTAYDRSGEDWHLIKSQGQMRTNSAEDASDSDKPHRKGRSSAIIQNTLPSQYLSALAEARRFFETSQTLLCLLGNDGRHDFLQREEPMGGIEKNVVTLAMTLHRLAVNFIVVAPCLAEDSIGVRLPGVAFPVFCMQQTGPNFIEEATEFISALNPLPAVVLSQSDWSILVNERTNIPQVISSHDHDPAIAMKLRFTSNVCHRKAPLGKKPSHMLIYLLFIYY